MQIRAGRSGAIDLKRNDRERLNLAQLVRSEGYQSLLDIFELMCIEYETLLVKTDAADSAAVLANHKISQAAWSLFVGVQERIKREIEAAAGNTPLSDLIDRDTRITDAVADAAVQISNAGLAGDL